MVAEGALQPAITLCYSPDPDVHQQVRDLVSCIFNFNYKSEISKTIYRGLMREYVLMLLRVLAPRRQ